VSLTGFSSPDARLYAPGTSGVRFFDVEGEHEFDPRLVAASLDTGGRCFHAAALRGFAAYALPPVPTPRWLYASNAADDGATPESGGVVLYDVGTAGGRPDDPLTSVVELARYVHQSASDPEVRPASFHGLAVRPVGAAASAGHAVYVAYGPKSSPGREPTVGIVVLRVRRDPEMPAGIRMEFVKKVEAAFAAGSCSASGAACPDAQAGRVTWDEFAPGHPRLYVAFGCNGLAMYDATSPLDPVCEAWRPEGTAFQIVRGPLHDGAHRLYVSFSHEGAGKGLGVIGDLKGFATLPIAYVPLPSQCLGIALEPLDATRRTLYAAGARDGIYRLRVDP
jgi:hypothetical protein